MSQNDLDIGNITFPAFRTELNLQLKALASLQSHATDSTEPPTLVANMLWFDTGANTLKIRNAANTGWIEVVDVDQTNSVVNLISKLTAPNGSVSLPSVTFDSDKDTGIFRKTTNTLGFSAGGNEVMTATHDGTDFTITMGDWTIYQSSNDLLFSHGGADKMKLDSDGGLTIY